MEKETLEEADDTIVPIKKVTIDELLKEHGENLTESEFKILNNKIKMKQETLEEFIDKVDTPADFDQFTFDEGIRVGAKWQAERMYSEAIEFAEWIRIKDFQTASKDNWIGLDMKYYTTEELFEQFKKK